MVHFPDEFPREEVLILLPLLRGNLPASRREAARAAWVVVGYGLGAALPAEGLAAISVVECCDLLEATCKGDDKSVGRAAAAIPWHMILRTLWPVLQKLIENFIESP